MSALASLADYGDGEEDAAPPAALPSTQTTQPSSATPALASTAATAQHASVSPPPVPSETIGAPAADKHPQSAPSPSFIRTPSSFTSTIAHLLPPLPPPITASNPAIEAKIQNFFGALQKGHSVSAQLRSSKRFNNPDIVEKLVTFFELDEIGSNFSTPVFDPHAPFLQQEDYKALADRQENRHLPPSRTTVDFEASKEEKDMQGAVTHEKSGNAATDNGVGAKRSKWDMAPEEGAPTAKAAKPAAVPAPVPKAAEEKSAYRQFLEKRKGAK